MNIIGYLVIFVIFYLMYVFFVIMRKKSLEKFQTSTYIMYLKNVYKVKTEQMNPYTLAHIIALTNSFILATSMYVVCNVDGKWQWIITFVSVMVLLFGSYHIIGKILKKKGDKHV
jgi:hypothetical protein